MGREKGKACNAGKMFQRLSIHEMGREAEDEKTHENSVQDEE